MKMQRTLLPPPASLSELADRLVEGRYQAPWEILKEPHHYNDGTTHFTHVAFHSDTVQGDVMVAQHVTPELAELLCLLHNNLSVIVLALRRASEAVGDAVARPRGKETES